MCTTLGDTPIYPIPISDIAILNFRWNFMTLKSFTKVQHPYPCVMKVIAVNSMTPGIVFWKPIPRASASLGRTGHLLNRSFSVCGLACSACFALHGEKAHCSVACGSIHASTFPLPGLQMGPIVKLVIFMQIWPFHFLTTHKGQSPYIQEPG